MRVIAFVAGGLLLLGCSGHGGSRVDGVQVGNGNKVRHSSEDYKFVVDYDRNLKLKIASPEKLTLSDAQGNRMRLQVLTGASVPTIDDVRRQLELRFPQRLFEAIDRGRLVGWRADGIQGLWTPRGDMLLAEVFTHSAPLISILDDIRFDDQPPTVTQLQLLTDNVAKRDRVMMRLRAFDDISGVKPVVHGHLVRTVAPPPGTRCQSDYFFTQTLRPTLGDPSLYAMSFPLHADLCEGEWALSTLSVWDRAANDADLHVPVAQWPPKPGAVYPGTTLPIPVLQVTGPRVGRDTERPQVTALSGGAVKIKAGHPTAITFEAVDVGSGIALEGDHWGEIIATRGDTPPHIVTGDARSLGNHRYELVVHFPAFVPSGEYLLRRFIVRDGDGNSRTLEITPRPMDGKPWCYRQTNIPVLTWQVENPDIVDTVPPTVEHLAFDKKQYLPGERGRLTFDATDDRSGIVDYMTSAAEIVLGIKVAVRAQGPIRRLGKTHFAVDFRVPNDATVGGGYLLREFRLRDRAGNERILDLRGALTPMPQMSVISSERN